VPFLAAQGFADVDIRRNVYVAAGYLLVAWSLRNHTAHESK